MSINVERNFTVRGQINCLYTPDTTELTEQIAGLEVQLWQKSPLKIIFLGKGLTDSDGVFIIEFEVETPNTIVVDGKIDDVFLKVIYNGEVIIGDLDDGPSFD